MRWTDFAENKLADYMRGRGLTLPTSWYVGLASVAGDSSITEVSGTSYARVAVARSLTAWAGTQGVGSVLASSGTSHQTSNNAAINLGTPGSGGWGTANYLVLYDASTGGNAWAYIPLTGALSLPAGTPVSFDPAAVVFTLGVTGGMSDWLSNKLIDLIWRGQAFSWPATLYFAYGTSASSAAAGGTEPAVGGYARVAVTMDWDQWSATDGEGTAGIVSAGTAGLISNNNPIVWPTPTADQGTIIGIMVFDAATLGNFFFFVPLTTPKTVVLGGGSPRYDAGGFEIAMA